MKFESEIKQWGNSLALRISSPMAQESLLAKGVRVVVETSEGQLTVKPKVVKQAFELPFTESQLLQGLDRNNAHADELATLSSKDLILE